MLGGPYPPPSGNTWRRFGSVSTSCHRCSARHFGRRLLPLWVALSSIALADCAEMLRRCLPSLTPGTAIAQTSSRNSPPQRYWMVPVAWTVALGSCSDPCHMGVLQEALESIRLFIIACMMMKNICICSHGYVIYTHAIFLVLKWYV